MNYIIYDLEATCWKDNSGKTNETIEIGAVRYSCNKDRVEPMDSYSRFIKPIIEPVLSDFCTDLTSIKQGHVDNAKGYVEVFENFMEWVKLNGAMDDTMFCSWGEYDWKQLKRDCELHKIDFPINMKQVINLKTSFSDFHKTKKRFGVRRALSKMGMDFEGNHHRGIDDAKNIGRIFEVMFEKGYEFKANSYKLKKSR